MREKGEIARYEQFLLFPQCFQKNCTAYEYTYKLEHIIVESANTLAPNSLLLAHGGLLTWVQKMNKVLHLIDIEMQYFHFFFSSTLREDEYLFKIKIVLRAGDNCIGPVGLEC